MCTQDYGALTEAMRDAERIEATHRCILILRETKSRPGKTEMEGMVPMDICNIQLKKRTPAQRKNE